MYILRCKINICIIYICKSKVCPHFNIVKLKLQSLDMNIYM